MQFKAALLAAVVGLAASVNGQGQLRGAGAPQHFSAGDRGVEPGLAARLEAAQAAMRTRRFDPAAYVAGVPQHVSAGDHGVEPGLAARLAALNRGIEPFHGLAGEAIRHP
jgi:hypothetical protein